MSDVSGKLGQTVPIDIFSQEFCVLCVNKECSRSRSNDMLFDRRANNWKSDLFVNTPRAKDGESQYDGIRSKNFISVTSDVPNVPQNTFESTEVEQHKPSIEIKIEQEQEKEPPSIEIKTEQEQEKKPEINPPQQIPETPLEPEINPQQISNPGNTSFEQGVVLPGKPKEIRLESGQSYTFGSDDETN